MRAGKIEQPAWWDVIDADEIRSELAYECEVAGGLFERSEGFACSIRRKRAIGDSLGVKLFRIATEKFSIHAYAGTIDDRFGHASQTAKILRLVIRFRIADAGAGGNAEIAGRKSQCVPGLPKALPVSSRHNILRA